MVVNLKYISRVIFLICCLCSLVLFASCSKNEGQNMAAAHQVPVSAITVHSDYVPVAYKYAGLITSENATKIVPQVSGVLLSNNFVEGAPVKRGDILFTIDAKEYSMRVKEASAKVETAKALYLQAHQATERSAKLLAQKFLSEAMSQEIIAKEQEALNNLKQAQAAYEEAKLNLAHCTIRAPIEGTMGRKLIAEGSIVSAGSSVLGILTQLNNLAVDFAISDKDFIDIKNALKAKSSELLVTIIGGNGQTSSASLKLPISVIDPDTGTVKAKALLNSKSNFIPGQFVRLILKGVKEYGIAIEEGSLVQDLKDTYVYAIKPVKMMPKLPAQLLAIKVPVHVLRQLDDRRWLVEADSLHNGEKVLTNGLFTVEGAMAAIAGKLPGVPVKLVKLDGHQQ